MKKLLMFVCTLAIATTTFAGQAKSAPTGKYSGTVASYDASSKMLTLTKGEKESAFQIKDDSQVVMGKAKADPTALAAGLSAKVEYVMDGAVKVVQKVELSGTTSKK